MPDKPKLRGHHKKLAKSAKHWQGQFEDKELDRFVWAGGDPKAELAGAVESFTGEKGLALDVGCGIGPFTRYLSERGFSPVLGFDIARSAVQRAERFEPKAIPAPSYVIAAAPYLPIRYESVWLLTDRGCLHVLDDSLWPDYVAEAGRVLAIHGRLVLTERKAHWDQLQPLMLECFSLVNSREFNLQMTPDRHVTMVQAILTKDSPALGEAGKIALKLEEVTPN